MPVTKEQLDPYLNSVYVRGARGPVEMDCYGLVRLARSELYGKPIMPLCSEAEPGRLKAITEACGEVSGLMAMSPCRAREGAVATAWRASLCEHVGLVVVADGKMWVLETDTPSGPCLTTIRAFEARYTKVIYYDD